MTAMARRAAFVLALSAATAVTAAVLVWQQPSLYESTGTYVVRPRSLETTDELRAFDTLVRGAEINATYAAVARSAAIRERAEAVLDAALPADGLTVSADVLTGTNVLSISVEGHDPEAVHELASAVGAETQEYVRQLGDLYQLQQLDPPWPPTAPAGPRRLLTVGMGVTSGGVLGVGLVLGWERVRRLPLPWTAGTGGGRPEAPAGDDELRTRVAELQSAGRPFAVSVLTVRPRSRDPASPHLVDLADPARVIALLRPTLCHDDLLGCLSGSRYVAVLPGAGAQRAAGLVAVWRLAVGAVLAGANGDHPESPQITTSVCAYADGAFAGDDEARRVARWLALAVARSGERA